MNRYLNKYLLHIILWLLYCGWLEVHADINDLLYSMLDHNQGRYTQAIEGLKKLRLQPLEEQSNWELREVAYYLASSYYHLSRYDEALAVVQDVLSWVPEHYQAKFFDLLGHIHWDNDNFTAAAAAFREATQESKWVFINDNEYQTRLDWLARSLEEAGYDALQRGDKVTARKSLQEALDTLNTTIKRSNEQQYSNALRNRALDLTLKLSRLPQWGQATTFRPIPVTQEQLFAEVRPYLDANQQAMLKYPFRIDDEMRAYAQRHLSGLPDEFSKVRKLLRLFIAPSGLNVKSVYDHTIHEDKKFSISRDAWEVFHELRPGFAEYGLDPDQRYRMGDCESQNNLFIALARAAGLNAFMVRNFVDMDKNWIGTHRTIGVMTGSDRMVLVDLTWYTSYDATYEVFRPVNDKENFAYFIASSKILGANNDAFFNAALQALQDFIVKFS